MHLYCTLTLPNTVAFIEENISYSSDDQLNICKSVGTPTMDVPFSGVIVAIDQNFIFYGYLTDITI